MLHISTLLVNVLAFLRTTMLNEESLMKAETLTESVLIRVFRGVRGGILPSLRKVPTSPSFSEFSL